MGGRKRKKNECGELDWSFISISELDGEHHISFMVVGRKGNQPKACTQYSLHLWARNYCVIHLDQPDGSIQAQIALILGIQQVQKKNQFKVIKYET